jgi:phospholipid/cholesterol/gamma-HCH transport system permease protein
MNSPEALEHAGAPRSFVVDAVERAGEPTALGVRGRLSFGDTHALWEELARREAQLGQARALDLDVSGLEAVDGGSMALLVHLRSRLAQRGVTCEFVGASPDVQEMVKLYGGDMRVKRPPRRRAKGLLDQVGSATLVVLFELRSVLGFVGDLIVASGRVLRRPRSLNWRDLPHLVERAGADGVPVILLINLLVGMVMAFQAANQLKQYGANILVANLIGISVTRELGPLITAIVVAGRTGAAFAAELGTMRVNEEIDALRTMGMGPMAFLVMPRILTLSLVMPLLVVLADAVGVLGGLIVGVASLDLTATAYFEQTTKVVRMWDFLTGVLKSVPFGAVIALIACQQGLATEGGAEGVGRRTTASVVITLFVLILLDAVFTIFFRAVGI